MSDGKGNTLRYSREFFFASLAPELQLPEELRRARYELYTKAMEEVIEHLYCKKKALWMYATEFAPDIYSLSFHDHETFPQGGTTGYLLTREEILLISSMEAEKLSRAAGETPYPCIADARRHNLNMLCGLIDRKLRTGLDLQNHIKPLVHFPSSGPTLVL